MTRLLALSGSLRRHASNTAVLAAAAALAPADAEVERFDGLAELPLFDPDAPSAPPSVERLRARLAAADGLLVANLEPPYGVSAALMNALEWLTAPGDLADLPTAVLGPDRGDDGLLDALRAMGARLVPAACLTVPLGSDAVTAEQIAADEPLAAPVRACLAALTAAIADAPRAPRAFTPFGSHAPGPCFVASFHDALALGPPPPGNHAVPVFAHGRLTTEMYAPRHRDLQTPHSRDELYVVARGSSRFVEPDGTRDVEAGAFIFVPAGRPHRFIDMSADFATWVCFFGPDGGERA